ncbi:Methyltransferase domain-containing protein [Saccharopolyspora antimicrobica]|uniref:Methyltransferase domain-containing protein n=1 Tax=Saccharopolyspora antimicrobica TaxID=455193 RepID=A0A1I4S3F7_9PSEU|nr:class I SAM-dependent methyltransferase [Saccharopolyspora antimicrobica]RKT87571.1 methyltransferase family protein [Saccharopolyspora antimicrobica]SFM59052.1 Methyltransferase domain-containing protein [Saccharopolyspora antimicrobica]
MTDNQQAEAWNGWEGELWASNPERYDGMLDDFNAPLFAAAGIGGDHRVLDIGCGPGSTTRLAAERAAHAVGVDISAPMVTRARADATGIANIEFVLADAQVHPFPEAGFDVAISRGGVMFFADPVAGFANIRRALRPGGRLAFISPTTPDPDGDYARATAALAEFMTRPSPAATGMMSLAAPERIREVLDAAGFRDIAVEKVQATENLGANAADAADFICSLSPVQFNLRDVERSTVDRIRGEVAAGFRPHETPQGVQVRGTVWLTSAIR